MIRFKAEIKRFPPFSFVVSEIMLKFAATPIVRKGEVGQNFSGQKDVYERYLLSSDLANLKYKKIRNRNVHYGYIVPYSFFEWYQYDSAWAIELLILVQGNARARRWDRRSRAPTSFHLTNFNC